MYYDKYIILKYFNKTIRTFFKKSHYSHHFELELEMNVLTWTRAINKSYIKFSSKYIEAKPSYCILHTISFFLDESIIQWNALENVKFQNWKKNFRNFVISLYTSKISNIFFIGHSNYIDIILICSYWQEEQ